MQTAVSQKFPAPILVDKNSEHAMSSRRAVDKERSHLKFAYVERGDLRVMIVGHSCENHLFLCEQTARNLRHHPYIVNGISRMSKPDDVRIYAGTVAINWMTRESDVVAESHLLQDFLDRALKPAVLEFFKIATRVLDGSFRSDGVQGEPINLTIEKLNKLPRPRGLAQASED